VDDNGLADAMKSGLRFASFSGDALPEISSAADIPFTAKSKPVGSLIA
jgi:hypothetical protein